MKLMTINTHSYAEGEIDTTLDVFVSAIRDLNPDIVAMQEVNQLRTAKPVKDCDLIAWQGGIEPKDDNFGLCIARKLNDMGLNYKLVWLGIKHGYVVFDEGIAFLVKNDVSSTHAYALSETEDTDNWRKRMALVVKSQNMWFCNVHMGRWDDEKEPFKNQWQKLKNYTCNKSPMWIMGDFNIPADKRNEGYDLILSDGWHDTYTMAQDKDDGYTVKGSIDGWKDTEDICQRIDYIFADKKTDITSSYTVFNGKNKEVISDHYGIIIEF